MMNPITIMVAEDHHLVRRGLIAVLKAYPDLDVVAEATNGQEAVDLARDTRPEVVLMDLQMPVMDGAVATEHIKRALPATEVIILTTFGTDERNGQALRAGAATTLVKDIRPEELIETIRVVARNGTASR